LGFSPGSVSLPPFHLQLARLFNLLIEAISQTKQDAEKSGNPSFRGAQLWGRALARLNGREQPALRVLWARKVSLLGGFYEEGFLASLE
jgi:hypothetical protein